MKQTVNGIALSFLAWGTALAAFPGTNGKIEFTASRDGTNQIYSMKADGTLIAFRSDRDGYFQTYVMNANGTGQSNISNSGTQDTQLAWQVVPDTDGDGVLDEADNCTLVANPTQVDSDHDGYGNRCDGDLNNDGFINAFDTPLYRAQLGQPSVAPAYNAADINANGFVNAFDTPLYRALRGAPPVARVDGSLLAQAARSPVESWAEYWQRRLAGLPRIFTVDQVQIAQYAAGDGQEEIIARFPLVIAPQTYASDSPIRAHLDAIRSYNPDSILLAYQIPFEDVLPLGTGPGYDAMRHLRSIESAYMHDARGNRLSVTELSGTRGMFDPRSPDVRAAIQAAVAAVLGAYPHDGIFFDNYGVKNPMLLDSKGNQFTGAPGQVWSEADYAAKLDAMTTLAEEIRAAWPGALFIANSANLFPAFNGELVEGSSQYYRMLVQAAELPGRAQPFIPLFQDTPVTGPDDPLIATRLAEVNAHGGWYGAAITNSRILWPRAFAP